MKLNFAPDVEHFRREFTDFLSAHQPAEAEAASERSTSSAHIPDWARRWQRTLFDHGWLQPAYPPEFGGRNASVVQQYVYFESDV